MFGEIGWGWGEIRSLMSYYVEEQVSEESTCHMSYEGHVNTLYLRRMQGVDKSFDGVEVEKIQYLATEYIRTNVHQ